MLKAAVPCEAAPQGLLPLQSLLRVRDLIAAAPAIRHPTAELERIAGLDRWTLARHFALPLEQAPLVSGRCASLIERAL